MFDLWSTGIAGHGSIYTEGIRLLADWKMLSPRRTGWSCNRGVISPHNSEGASKLLINQNLRFQEKTLPVPPPPPSPRVPVPSRALEGRSVLIIARGWPLFTPPIFHPPPREAPSSFYERKFARSRCRRCCCLIADRYTRLIANRRTLRRFERERVISSPLTRRAPMIIATEASPSTTPVCSLHAPSWPCATLTNILRLRLSKLVPVFNSPRLSTSKQWNRL